MPQKKRKRSGLSGMKAGAAYDALVELRKVLEKYADEEVEGTEEEQQKAEAAEEEMQTLLERLEKLLIAAAPSKVWLLRRISTFLITAQAVPFSEADMMDTMNIRPAQPEFLVAKPPTTLNDIVSQSADSGSTQFWNAANTKIHLDFLLRTVPRKSEAASCLIIDTLLFRAASMLPADSTQVIVLHLEAKIPPMKCFNSSQTHLSGFINYVSLLVAKNKHSAKKDPLRQQGQTP
ncbi:hypothetical protein B0H16DRAFT_1737158 [Mycena metata]|uniref:Uncharacterized protein n=1 Tax=Mycena metata TaxID=1033252 RepID=A0AAD7MMY2_9AGAR|nr:hypothetical protein B0H16DRAFT_1737158 [Mycena metata]